MNKFKFAAVFAAGVALTLSSAHVAAQEAEAKRASLGAQIRPHAEGGEIAGLLPDRTGAAVGLQVGDILLEAGGKTISPEVLSEYMKAMKVGDQVSFKVKRAGVVMDLSGKAVAAPEAAPAPATAN